MPRKYPGPTSPLILLVADVEDNLDVYTQFILHNGWRAATASSGQDALAQTVSLRPAVIVLDMEMPVMDGREDSTDSRRPPYARDPDHCSYGTCLP